MPDTIDDVDEHPIIFNEWSIRRILAGEKTQTRRVADQDFRMQQAERINRCSDYTFDFIFEDDTGMLRKCPYGQPGDVLWVREGFQFPEFEDDVSPRDLVDYWVGEAGAPPPVKYSTGETKRAWNGHDWGRKRPSIHMPRELCRIRLRVEDVRVERVQEISTEDALSEGISLGDFETNTVRFEDDPRLKFADKWRDIHGDGAWERNDWVWVVEFSQINE